MAADKSAGEKPKKKVTMGLPFFAELFLQTFFAEHYLQNNVF
ncbi:hypothetical protein N9514_01255 [Pseudomonadales bacterium]|nr:hypothetical protein [Pseudomonadales bacterium]MDB9879012.1 hypothetical protein [Pseudomonadales bacterium]